MGKYAIDPAFDEMPSFAFPRNLWGLRLVNLLIKRMHFGYKWSKDLQVTKHKVTGFDGNTFKVIEVARNDAPQDAPAIIYYHGGAYCFTYAGIHMDCAQIYARECNARVFLVDYRLSTKSPFPAAQNDAQSAIEWVFDNASSLGVDRNRMALVGDSAGGGLAASCTQMTRDRNAHREEAINLLAQFLIYPVCDCETKTESAQNFTDTPVWTTHNNQVMWDVYLRGSDWANGVAGAKPPKYASPVHCDDLSGLPPAFIEPTEFDPLRDEAVDYANALEQAGVAVELIEAKGAVHGYEFIDCEITDRYRRMRVQAMNRFFAQ